MFSSNQILTISGTFDQLIDVLHLVEKMEGKSKSFQITKDGRYCLGWCSDVEGWEKFQFEYDAEIVAKIIEQYLKSVDVEDEYEYYFDGSTELGFKMEVIEYGCEENNKGIHNANYGTVVFSPYVCFYAK